MNDDPQSECTNPGKPNTENKCDKHFITVPAFTSWHGMLKCEYSSIIVSMKVFLVSEGNGPLKSRFSLSNGRVALIRCA